MLKTIDRWRRTRSAKPAPVSGGWSASALSAMARVSDCLIHLYGKQTGGGCESFARLQSDRGTAFLYHDCRHVKTGGGSDLARKAVRARALVKSAGLPERARSVEIERDLRSNLTFLHPK